MRDVAEIEEGFLTSRTPFGMTNLRWLVILDAGYGWVELVDDFGDGALLCFVWR
jgi:hypothetical protein